MAKFTKEEIGDFMNAEAAREKSLVPQLKSIFKEIQEAVDAGRQSTSLMFQKAYPEVIDQLVEMGYDVEVTEHTGELSHTFTTISWEQGKKTHGKLETVNK